MTVDGKTNNVIFGKAVDYGPANPASANVVCILRVPILPNGSPLYGTRVTSWTVTTRGACTLTPFFTRPSNDKWWYPMTTGEQNLFIYGMGTTRTITAAGTYTFPWAAVPFGANPAKDVLDLTGMTMTLGWYVQGASNINCVASGAGSQYLGTKAPFSPPWLQEYFFSFGTSTTQGAWAIQLNYQDVITPIPLPVTYQFDLQSRTKVGNIQFIPGAVSGALPANYGVEVYVGDAGSMMKCTAPTSIVWIWNNITACYGFSGQYVWVYVPSTAWGQIAEIKIGAYNPVQKLCSICDVGTYCVTPDLVYPCPVNTSSLAGSTQLENCTLCLVGYVKTGPLSCTGCMPGYQCPNMTTELICPQGWYSAEASTVCTICPNNTYSTQDGTVVCTACPFNSTSPPGSKALSTCSCNPGFEQNPDTFQCTACTAGAFCVNNVKNICPQNTYSNSTQPACTACGSTAYNDGNESIICMPLEGSYARTPYVWLFCPTGSFSNQTNRTSCIQCTAGMYASTLGRTNCSSCMPGAYSLLGAPTCTNCVGGKYSNTTEATFCYSCVAGQYTSAAGLSVCTSCSPGSYSVAGSSVCPLCPTGQYTSASSLTVCSVCDAGWYASASGKSECTYCLAGTYSTASGLSVCTQCPTSSISPDASANIASCSCNTGYYPLLAGIVTEYVSKPFLLFQPLLSQYWMTPTTNRNDPRIFVNGVNTPASGGWTPMNGWTAMGYLILDLLSVTTVRGVATAGCVTVNQYVSLYKLEFSNDGVSYTNYSSTMPSQADVTSYFFPTPIVGRYLRFTPLAVSGQQWWRIAVYLNSSYSPVIGMPFTCPVCSAGGYCNESTFTKCPVNTTSLQGSVMIENCSLCIPGYTKTGPYSCRACTPGFYCPNSTSEIACPVNYYSNSTATVCTACSNTSYTNDTGFDRCMCKPGGVYVNRYSCSSCNAGSFSNETDATNCSICDSGKYTVTFGLDKCTACPAGTFNVAGSSGASGCTQCVGGSYSGISGSSSCMPCIPGRYTNSSILCPVNYVPLDSACNCIYNNLCQCISGSASPTTLRIIPVSGSCSFASAAVVAKTWDGVGQSTPGSYSGYPLTTSPVASPVYIQYDMGSVLMVSMINVFPFWSTGGSRWYSALWVDISTTGVFTGEQTRLRGCNSTTSRCNITSSGMSFFFPRQSVRYIRWYMSQDGSSGDSAFLQVMIYDSASCPDAGGGSGGFTTCTDCAAGRYSSTNGSTACATCAAASYSNVSSSSFCYACQPTYSTYPGAYSGDQCVCPPGSVFNGSICTCPNTTYRVVNASAIGGWQCNLCPAGSYCLGDSNAPTACPGNNYCLAGAPAPTPCTTCIPSTYESVSCLATRNRVCPSCTNAPSHATYPMKSYSPICPWVCDSQYGGPACAPCARGYWCLLGVQNTCPYNSISPPMSFAQNNCTCSPGYSSQGSSPGTSPCVKCKTGTICPGGQAAAAPVVSMVKLANITQTIMVQKPLPTVNSLVALLLSVPGISLALLKSITTSSNVAIYTRQVCRSSYCINCDRTSSCVSQKTVLVSSVNGKYALNVTTLSYDVLYTFVVTPAGLCAPTFALSAEYVTGAMVALTSTSGISSVQFACSSTPSLSGNISVEPSAGVGRRRLLQVSNDTLAVDFVVPPNETTAVDNAIQSQNLTVQGYTSTEAAPGLIFSCPGGSSSGEGSSSISDCACLPGYEGNASNGSDCILCRNATYCASGVLSRCPENGYSPSGSSSFSDCACSPGFYGNTTCVQCPANAFCTGAMAIQNCTPRAVSAVQSTGPAACYCEPGYYGVADTPCQACEPGTWCWTGIRNMCPLNSMSDALSTRITDCACRDGYETIVGVDSNGRDTRLCNLCAEGTYCKVSFGDLIFKGGARPWCDAVSISVDAVYDINPHIDHCFRVSRRVHPCN